MKKIYFVMILMTVAASCEKVWVEDLEEKAYDTIRGKYEIESAVWEGSEPIDIDGDGTASFDYYEECNNDNFLFDAGRSRVKNDSGTLAVPYTVDENAHWNGPVSLGRKYRQVDFKINAVLDGEECRLEFQFPSDSDVQFEHSGYGEITLRTDVTFTVRTPDGRTEEKSGPVFIRYKRTEYWID